MTHQIGTLLRLLTVTATLLLVACDQFGSTARHLDRAEQMFIDDPQAAIASLDSIQPEEFISSKQRARYAMYYTLARYYLGYQDSNDSLINIAVNYYRKHGPKDHLVKCLQLKSQTNLQSHELGKAVLAATEVVRMAKKDSDFVLMAKGEEVLARAFRLTQKHDDCLKHSRRAAEYYKRAGKEVNHWFCLTDVVDAYTMNSNTYDKATALLDSLDRVVTNQGVLSDCNTLRMYIYLDQKDYNKAEECMHKIMNSRDDYRSGPVEHTWMARIKHARGDIEGSKREIDSAWTGVRDKLDKVYITRSVYLMVKEDGNWQRATVYADSLIEYTNDAANEGFRQSVVTAQRDFYSSEAKREVNAKAHLQRLTIAIIMFLLLVIIMVVAVQHIRMHLKNGLIESKMNEILLLSERVRKDDKENQNLKLLAERSMRDRWDTVNMLCNEYFEKGDNERLKATIINRVDEEMERICSKKHMAEIEQLVNSSMNGIVDKLRAECPTFKEEDVLFATLVYAGLAPRAVCLCTGIKLKYYYTKRMRLVERINNSDAADKELLISKLWRNTDKEPVTRERKTGEQKG